MITVYDLAAMPNGELSAAIYSTMYKGFEFNINDITYNVKNISKLNKTKDIESSITHKQNITITSSNLNKNIRGYLIYYKNGSSCYYGNKYWDQLSRDIDGIITLDLININNIFHTKSKLFNLAEIYVNSYNNKNK